MDSSDFAPGASQPRGDPKADSDESEVLRIFCEAIDLPIAERASLLARECRGDEELRARVERLLAAAEREDEFLRAEDGPAGARSGSEGEEPLEPGVRVGAYTLLERLGEGGFAVVFSAQQERPVRRRVALKVLRRDIGQGAVARFDQERQALARMDHPGIARVFDASTRASVSLRRSSDGASPLPGSAPSAR